MRKILLIDLNQSFTADIERILIINEYEDIDIISKNNIDEALMQLSKINPDEIVIAASIVKSTNWQEYGVLVKAYARNNEELLIVNNCKIPCFGIVKKASELVNMIINNKTIEIYSSNDTENTTDVLTADTLPKSRVVELSQQQQAQDEVSVPTQQTNNGYEPTYAYPQYQQYPQYPQYPQYTEAQLQEYYNYLRQYYGEQAKYYTGYYNESKVLKAESETTQSIAQKQFNQAMGYEKKNARCITVYSAKGGVGKTTISCELATFLALTVHGRGNYRVCIADFNIDFGDVLNTLSFNPQGANMTTWATEIRERINMGEAPESINYSQERIMTWLQKNEKDNLYALLAPITNADSMDISEKEIQIMLRNLIENAGFDFIICDTGNNTRDSSFIALEMADDILLVLTQSINTANCNNSFLNTARRINFDMSKFKLVINKVKPAKLVGVSTEELENAFIDPISGKPYNFKCVAKIKDNNDVKSYNNLGEPLVYNSSHEFTKAIGELVHNVIGTQTILQKPSKKGFFSSLFKKK